MLPHSIAEGTRICATVREQVDARSELYGRWFRPACPGRTLASSSETPPDEPRDDHELRCPHPHVRVAPVHDGPVGDPAASQLIRHEGVSAYRHFSAASSRRVRAVGLLRRNSTIATATAHPAPQGPRAGGLGERERGRASGGPELPVASFSRRPESVTNRRSTLPVAARLPHRSRNLLMGERRPGVARTGVGHPARRHRPRDRPPGPRCIRARRQPDSVSAEPWQQPELRPVVS